ncbi:MAG TPA: hypothetical protein VGM65_15815 [Candidatus Udaeobacter sp.]
MKCNWATYKDNLALGAYDITHHLVMYFLKPFGCNRVWWSGKYNREFE